MTSSQDSACLFMQDIQKKSEKISEMTAVLWQAANMEDHTSDDHDVIVRLQRENHAMRELLQLELLDSADTPTGTETQKPPSADAAIQTHSSFDDGPFYTGDFATIRSRPPSSATPPSAKSCSASENTRSPPCPQNRGDVDRCSQTPQSENTADVSSDRVELSNDACSSHVVEDTDCNPADETGHVNSSDSLETLVNPSDLAANDEYL